MEFFYIRFNVLKFAGYNLKKNQTRPLLTEGCQLTDNLPCFWFIIPPIFFQKWIFCVILSRCISQGLSIFLWHNLLLSYHWPWVFRAENWFALAKSQGFPREGHEVAGQASLFLFTLCSMQELALCPPIGSVSAVRANTGKEAKEAKETHAQIVLILASVCRCLMWFKSQIKTFHWGLQDLRWLLGCHTPHNLQS